MAFGIGCVGVDLLSEKQEPLAIKDSKSRTRISSFLERVAVDSSKELNDVSIVSEDDFSNLSAAEKPEQKPLTRPPSKLEQTYKDGLQKQVTVPSASFQLPTLPERTKVPHELIPKISIHTPKLPATPPAPKITIPNLSNAIGDAIGSVPAVPKLQLKVNTKALEHTGLNVIFTSQKAVDTAIAATPKIARVVNATAKAVAHRGGELANHTVSAVNSLPQKGNQTIQALKNSGASIPTEFKSEGNFDERDNSAAKDEIDNADPELPDGTKNLGGGKYRLPDGTLMQKVDCQTGQPLTR